MPDIDAFQKNIGIIIRERSLLETALTHTSFVNESPDASVTSNERLEFLGDAVLGLVVAEKLYQDYPGLSEGNMTKLRSALVCRETLAVVAGRIGLGDYLYLGKGEESSGGRGKVTNLAGAMEAVIAAVFLDRGMETVREFILKLLDAEMARAVDRGRVIDYKSRLQEIIQSREQLIPSYILVKTEGPDHDRVFSVRVMAGKKVLGRGAGKSKKSAETAAAREALRRLSPDAIE